MALSRKKWNLLKVRGATMIGSKIDSDRSLDFPFREVSISLYLLIDLVMRKLKIQNHLLDRWPHFVKSGLFSQQ